VSVHVRDDEAIFVSCELPASASLQLAPSGSLDYVVADAPTALEMTDGEGILEGEADLGAEPAVTRSTSATTLDDFKRFGAKRQNCRHKKGGPPKRASFCWLSV